MSVRPLYIETWKLKRFRKKRNLLGFKVSAFIDLPIQADGSRNISKMFQPFCNSSSF